MRIGINVGLPGLFGGGFNPAALFTGGVQGAWYDPSDSTTLFSDTAGTTPVAQPGAGAQVVVGLMLDKSQNGVGANGAKRVNLLTQTEAFNDAAWARLNNTVTPNAAAAPDGTTTADLIVSTGGETRVGLNPGIVAANTAYTASIFGKFSNANGRYLWFRDFYSSRDAGFDLQNGVVTQVSANMSASIAVAANGFFRCVVTWTTPGSAVVVNQQYWVQSSSSSNPSSGITGGEFLIWGADLRLASEASTAPTYQPITSSWYATLPGNHAISYNSTTARPELSARVNLLTYSEQFDNTSSAGWVVSATTVTANTNETTDPAGGNTADKLLETATTALHELYAGTSNGRSVTNGVTYTWSVYVKDAGRRYFGLWLSSYKVVVFDLTTLTVTYTTPTGSGSPTGTITDVGNGWRRCTYTVTAVATANPFWGMGTSDSGTAYVAFAGDAAKGVYIWGADARIANIGSSIPYQRIADQYTYDNGPSFPRYLRFDGVDDGMSTPANLNLSSTDKATVFAGVRKLTSTAGNICELGPVVGTTANSFYLFSAATVASDYTFTISGAAPISNDKYCSNSATTFNAPISNVIATSANKAGYPTAANSVSMRVNAATPTQTYSTLGDWSSNFGSYPLYIGSRNNASLWFNGHLYSLIVRGAATDASTISATETWVANETGISIFDDGPSISLDFTSQTYQVWEV